VAKTVYIRAADATRCVWKTKKEDAAVAEPLWRWHLERWTAKPPQWINLRLLSYRSGYFNFVV